jgi:hypothetical protein
MRMLDASFLAENAPNARRCLCSKKIDNDNLDGQHSEVKKAQIKKDNT